MGAVERVRPRVSFADLERAPEDGRRYELYDGQVYVVPAPMPRHQRVQVRLVEWLDDYVDSFGGFAVCAPIDIVFSEYDVVQPDVLFFGPGRAHLIDLDRAIRHAPDLCAEILSPSTEAADRGRKLQMFARYGVPETGSSTPSQRSSRSTDWRLAATRSCSARRATTRWSRLSCQGPRSAREVFP
jgi:Uma2 family endonuclease